MRLAPVVLFVYNRPEHTRQTVEALLQNPEAVDTDLIVISDGPKNESAKKKVIEVRKYIASISGFKSVIVSERGENFGLARSIIDGVTEIVARYGRIIVLEDDLVVSPYFLRYMNSALELYNDESAIANINAYTFPVKEKLPETFFIKISACWGWATWKRGWDLFEKDGEKLLRDIKKKKLIREFNLNNAYHHFIQLEEQVNRLNDSWAIRWYASTFLAGKLSLYPGKSLVKNIGCDDSGVHTGAVNVFDVDFSDRPIEVKKIEIIENKSARSSIEKFFKSPNNYLFFKAIKFKNWVRLKIKTQIINIINKNN